MIIGLLYLFFFIHIAAVILAEFGFMLNDVFLRRTPMHVISIVTILAVGFTVRKGLETIARMNQLLFPIGIGLLLITVLLTLNKMNFLYFLPILENGFVPVLKGSMPILLWFGEIVILLIIYPQIMDKENAGRSIFYSLAALLVFMLLGTLSIAIFSAQETANFRYPALEMIKIIRIREFFQRFDTFFIALWIGGIYLKIVIFYYVSAVLCSHLFRLQHYKHTAFPIGSLIAVFSLIQFQNTTELGHFLRTIAPFYLYTFEIFIPLLLLVISIAFKKKEV